MSRCKVGEILKDAEPREASAVSSALQEKQGTAYVWSAKNLAAAINKTKYSVGATTIKEHRNFSCGCFK